MKHQHIIIQQSMLAMDTTTLQRLKFLICKFGFEFVLLVAYNMHCKLVKAFMRI